MIVGAIDISGMQSPGGGAVPYLEPKHQTGMKPSIISIYHTPVISSHDWGTIFGCRVFARDFEIFMGSERRQSVRGLHEKQLAKGYWWAGPRQSLISIL